MDIGAIAARHADYYASNMRSFLEGKPSARIGAAIEWTGAYCHQVLPGLLIDRKDPVVLLTQEKIDG